MSYNTANTPDGYGVLLYNGEVIVIYSQGVEMTLGVSDNLTLEGRRTGTIYLTSHRIIFMPNAGGDWLRSFEIPFNSLHEVHLEQPIFGANYLRGIAVAFPGSQMVGEVPWRMTFNKGGCIDFGQALLLAVDRASRFRPATAPPEYSPPVGNFYAAPPSYYQPANQGADGYNPSTAAFPEQPNPDRVFISGAPPPYPGIGPERPPQPTEELRVAGQFEAPPAYSESGEGLRRRV